MSVEKGSRWSIDGEIWTVRENEPWKVGLPGAVIMTGPLGQSEAWPLHLFTDTAFVQRVEEP